MGISTTGVGSGIDIRGLVDKLIEAESKDKIAKYDLDEATALAKISGIGVLKNVLSAFVDKLDGIQIANPFDQKKLSLTETNLGNAVVEVVALENVENGQYEIEVTQIAKEQKMGTIAFENQFEEVGTGTLTINVHDNAYPIEITEANNTLSGICSAINEYKNLTGISAKLINSEDGTSMVLTSQTGLDHTFTIAVTNDGDGNNADNAGLSRLRSANLSTLQNALNATVKIEGITVTSNSNVIDSAIDNVIFTLLDTNIGDPIKLDIADNLDSAKAFASDFVKSYNDVFDTIANLTQYNKDDPDQNGVLLADSTVRMISFALKKLISERVITLPGGVTSLMELGISSDRYTGKLSIDDEMMDDALKTKFASIKELFTNEESGIASRIESYLTDFVKMNGILQEKSIGLTKTITVVAEQRITLERHLISLEKRLLDQFIAMDKVVANLRQVSDFLTKQLDTLLEPMMISKK